MRQPVSSPATKRSRQSQSSLVNARSPFFFARLEPAFALELAELVNALSRILGQVLASSRPDWRQARAPSATTAITRPRTALFT